MAVDATCGLQYCGDVCVEYAHCNPHSSVTMHPYRGQGFFCTAPEHRYFCDFLRFLGILNETTRYVA